MKPTVVSADVLFEDHRGTLHWEWVAGLGASERRFDEVAVSLFLSDAFTQTLPIALVAIGVLAWALMDARQQARTGCVAFADLAGAAVAQQTFIPGAGSLELARRHGQGAAPLPLHAGVAGVGDGRLVVIPVAEPFAVVLAACLAGRPVAVRQPMR